MAFCGAAGTMSADYLRTDEQEDLLSSLKLVCISAQECRHDDQFWKWILVGTHSSLQAAIVFHLSFGNSFLVAKPNHTKKWLAAHQSGGNYPDMHMDYFLELYEKAKSQEVMGFRLTTHASQDESVKLLTELRNDFVHFMPKGWSIELAMLPPICLDSLALVEELARGPLRVRWESDSQAEHANALLSDSRDLIRTLQMNYDSN